MKDTPEGAARRFSHKSTINPARGLELIGTGGLAVMMHGPITRHWRA